MQGMCGERAGYSVAVLGKTFKLNETTLALFSFGVLRWGVLRRRGLRRTGILFSHLLFDHHTQMVIPPPLMRIGGTELTRSQIQLG